MTKVVIQTALINLEKYYLVDFLQEIPEGNSKQI
tara:strand:+ start:33 stop:134 length:102 start_codon:yes stop_codon:yes gene_type:complete